MWLPAPDSAGVFDVLLLLRNLSIFSYSLEKPFLLLRGSLAASPVFGERPCLTSFRNTGKQSTVASLTMGWLVCLMSCNISVRYQRLFFPIPCGIIQLIIILLTHNFIASTTEAFCILLQATKLTHYGVFCGRTLWLLAGRVRFLLLWEKRQVPFLSWPGLLQSVSRKTAFGFNS